MDFSLYFFPFLVSFLFSVVGAVFIIVAVDYLRLFTKRRGINRFGGVALIFAFCVGVLLNDALFLTDAIVGILIGSLYLLCVGVYDDVQPLSWRVQLALQIALVVLVFVLGVRIEAITNPFGGMISFVEGGWFFVGMLLLLTWVVLLMNAMNWVDGVDGISGGITLIAAGTIFALSLFPEVNQPPVGIVTMALMGSLVGFLIFNFYPARIVAGTSGSFFMGFILAALAIFAGAKMATTLLVLAVPIVDALWVIWERFRSGASVFRGGDGRHLHHRLRELGWSQRQVVWLYYGLTAVIAIIALNTRLVGKALTIAGVFAVLFVFVAWISWRLQRRVTLSHLS